jgi:hypothetical protein
VDNKPWATTLKLHWIADNQLRIEYLYDEEGGRTTATANFVLSNGLKQLAITPAIFPKMGTKFRRATL